MQNDLLNRILSEIDWTDDDFQRERAADLILNFLGQIESLKAKESDNAGSLISLRIAEIDRLISTQLSEILHHPDFQELESSWRGLLFLVSRSETGVLLNIRLLNCTKNELLRDFESVGEFDQTDLFQLIYKKEYGRLTGRPFGALIGDFEFGRTPRELNLLENLADLAAAAHAPFITAPSAAFFGWKDFSEMFDGLFYSTFFDREEYAKWHQLRQTENSRYISLVLPRTLGRRPYGKATKPAETFDFEEDVSDQEWEKDKYLWINSAYLLGTCLTRAFSKYGWCMAISGLEEGIEGGLVGDLPVHVFETDEDLTSSVGPAEVPIHGRREMEFSASGINPADCMVKMNFVVFFSNNSVYRPKIYEDPAVRKMDLAGSKLPYIFAASRFAHYLKFMMRDVFESRPFISFEDTEKFLNRWINKYALEDVTGTEEQKIRRPLASAEIKLTKPDEETGYYRADVRLNPHYQCEKLPFPLKITVDLPTIYL